MPFWLGGGGVCCTTLNKSESSCVSSFGYGVTDMAGWVKVLTASNLQLSKIGQSEKDRYVMLVTTHNTSPSV